MAYSEVIGPTSLADRFCDQLERAQNKLAEVETQLGQVEKERNELLKSKETLEIEIKLLEPLCDELREAEEKQEDAFWSDMKNLGSIQECCYRVLVESSKPMDATLIKDALEKRKVDINRYAQPMAVIHTSLKRIPDRVRTFKRKVQVVEGNPKIWVRYYEAIKPGTETPSKTK